MLDRRRNTEGRGWRTRGSCTAARTGTAGTSSASPRRGGCSSGTGRTPRPAAGSRRSRWASSWPGAGAAPSTRSCGGGAGPWWGRAVRRRTPEGAPGRDIPVASRPADDEFPRHTAVERRADAVVHALGLTLGVAGCVALAAIALPGADLLRLVAGGAYAAGLLAMLGCSALYNL